MVRFEVGKTYGYYPRLTAPVCSATCVKASRKAVSFRMEDGQVLHGNPRVFHYTEHGVVQVNTQTTFVCLNERDVHIRADWTPEYLTTCDIVEARA